MNEVNILIDRLLEVTSNFVYPEYYPHTDCMMWKINNEYTKYREDKLVLSPVSEGIEKALAIAAPMIAMKKDVFEKQ